MREIRTMQGEKFFNDWLERILEFSGIYVDKKGYMFNNSELKGEPYMLERNQKYVICAYWKESVLELVSNREQCAMFDPINNDQHSGLIMRMMKTALFYRLEEFIDDEDVSDEEREEIIVNRLIFEARSNTEPGYDDINLIAVDRFGNRRELLTVRLNSGITPNIKRFLFYYEILTLFDPRLMDKHNYSNSNIDYLRILDRNMINVFYNLINAMERERKLNYNFSKDLKSKANRDEASLERDGQYTIFDEEDVEKIEVVKDHKIGGYKEPDGLEIDGIDKINVGGYSDDGWEIDI